MVDSGGLIWWDDGDGGGLLEPVACSGELTCDLECCCNEGCCENQIVYPPQTGPIPPGTTILRATVVQIINPVDCLSAAPGCELDFADGVPAAGASWEFCLCDGPSGACLDGFRVLCVAHPDTGEDTLLLQFSNAITGCLPTHQCPDVDLDWYPFNASCNPVQFDFKITFKAETVPPCDRYLPTEVFIRLTISPNSPTT